MNVLIQKIKLIFPILLLCFGLYLELSTQTFNKLKHGIYWTPFLWMLGGFLFCIGAWMLNHNNKNVNQFQSQFKIKKSLFVFLIFSICAISMVRELKHIFFYVPIEGSDIIPSIQMYVRRFLGGDLVYRPLVFKGYEVAPTYFPILWLPYCFSEILKIDYRWTAYAVFLLSLFLLNLRLLKQNLSLLELAIKTILPFLFFYIYIKNVGDMFGLAVELMPAGLYLILTRTIFHRSRFIMALGIVLCLLSRYAFTFWLPIYLLIYWIEFGFKKVFEVSLYVLAGVILIYIIPFLSKDWTSLQKGLAYYEKTAVGQWKVQPWQPSDSKPYHLSQGMSYSILFYDFAEGSVNEKLKLNRKVHIAVCGLTAILLFLGYLYRRKKNLNIRLYLMIGLKFYLIIFYGFFYVPFAYLYILPFFLSIPILNEIRFKAIIPN